MTDRRPISAATGICAVGAVCALALLAYQLSFPPFHTVVMVAWTLLALCTYASARAAPWPYQRVWWTALVGFPVWEYALKFMIIRDVIPYSWFWLNRLEHLGWMASLLLLLTPACRRIWLLPSPFPLLFVLGLGGLIGNLNEFFEYALRLIWHTAGGSVWYSDTLLDMMTNVPGALLAFLIGWRLNRTSAPALEAEPALLN
ncbi:hypothetical protein [Deinococcus altitudinis]|uniref:hypothetical protein n=1 Tax=Deinococcus altitudinis TaxID=468914 RepID=UPI0038923659